MKTMTAFKKMDRIPKIWNILTWIQEWQDFAEEIILTQTEQHLSHSVVELCHLTQGYTKLMHEICLKQITVSSFFVKHYVVTAKLPFWQNHDSMLLFFSKAGLKCFESKLKEEIYTNSAFFSKKDSLVCLKQVSKERLSRLGF